LPTGGGPDGLSPILVRKGELVVFSPYVNSRVKSIYGQAANDFVPERWESDELANIAWAYFPFSGGPRRCLGEDFALMEISYTIVRLLRVSESIELPNGEENEPIGSERQRLSLVLAPADGCRVKLQLR
jgi:cytochrome P450